MPCILLRLVRPRNDYEMFANRLAKPAEPEHAPLLAKVRMLRDIYSAAQIAAALEACG